MNPALRELVRWLAEEAIADAVAAARAYHALTSTPEPQPPTVPPRGKEDPPPTFAPRRRHAGARGSSERPAVGDPTV